MIRLKERGETIVAVLISVAIVGLVLISTYVIVRRSFALGQAARERTQALKVVESQLEKLKYLVVSYKALQVPPLPNPLKPPVDGHPDGHTSNKFCISDSPSLAIVDLTDSSNTLDDCTLDDLVTSPGREFNFYIKYDHDGPDGSLSTYDDDTFILQAEWRRVNSDTIDKVIIYYRIHQPPIIFVPNLVTRA